MQGEVEMNNRAIVGFGECQKMEGTRFESWSTSSVGSGQRMQVCLCGLPAVSKTSWSNKNFRRRYNRCSMKEGCDFFDWLEPSKANCADANVPGRVENVSISEVEQKWKDKDIAAALLKEKETKLQKEKEKEIEKNGKEILMKFLKESQEREERYLKMLIGTWVLIACIVVSMILRGM